MLCKCVAPATVAVPPTCKLPPTVALLTDILPAIVAVTPLRFEPSPKKELAQTLSSTCKFPSRDTDPSTPNAPVI